MKRILALIAVMTLIMTMFVFTTTASAYYAVYSACPNGKPLNIRSGPGKEYSVIGKVPYGDAIYALGNVGGWLQLNDNGYVQASLTTTNYPGAYDPSKYQKKNSGSSTSSGSSSGSSSSGVYALYKKAKTVTPYLITLKSARSSGSANVRWAPSKQAPLMKAYAPGKEMRVIAELGSDWFQVEDPMTGEVGYVNKAYVVK